MGQSRMNIRSRRALRKSSMRNIIHAPVLVQLHPRWPPLHLRFAIHRIWWIEVFLLCIESMILRKIIPYTFTLPYFTSYTSTTHPPLPRFFPYRSKIPSSAPNTVPHQPKPQFQNLKSAFLSPQGHYHTQAHMSLSADPPPPFSEVRSR
jgi:hypothetical protein